MMACVLVGMIHSSTVRGLIGSFNFYLTRLKPFIPEPGVGGGSWVRGMSVGGVVLGLSWIFYKSEGVSKSFMKYRLHNYHMY